MMTIRLVWVALGVCCAVFPAERARSQQANAPERERMYHRYLEFASQVKGGVVEAHWMADGSSFWYADGQPDQTAIYKVDPRTNQKVSLLDASRLRTALAAALGHQPQYQGVPFDQFTFTD